MGNHDRFGLDRQKGLTQTKSPRRVWGYVCGDRVVNLKFLFISLPCSTLLRAVKPERNLFPLVSVSSASARILCCRCLTYRLPNERRLLLPFVLPPGAESPGRLLPKDRLPERISVEREGVENERLSEGRLLPNDRLPEFPGRISVERDGLEKVRLSLLLKFSLTVRLPPNPLRLSGVVTVVRVELSR